MDKFDLKSVLVEKWLSRKLLVFLSSCGLLMWKYIDQEIWLVIALTFMGATIASTLADGFKEKQKKISETLNSVLPSDKSEKKEEGPKE